MGIWLCYDIDDIPDRLKDGVACLTRRWESSRGGMKQGCSGASLSRYPLLCSLASINEILPLQMGRLTKLSDVKTSQVTREKIANDLMT